MKKIILLFFVFSISFAFAQDTVYAHFYFGTVDSPKVKQHIENELSTFRKIHEYRMEKGEILAWDMWQMVNSGTANAKSTTFLYVTFFKDFDDFEKWEILWDERASEISKKEKNKEFRSIIQSVFDDYTSISEYMVSSKGHFGTQHQAKPSNFMVLNYMSVENFREAEYEDLELNTFMGMHQRDGVRSGWELYKVLNNYLGTDQIINYITADYFNRFGDIMESRDTLTQEDQLDPIKEITELSDLTISDIFKNVSSLRPSDLKK